ncbi:hypothetical protein L916_02755 [Phytophthora nicotianae]|uniref:Uncharacterized protein n=1 Tax=Phytophthora nicotianae TaxID=4792 RepID=W2JPF0_PHYNI|nr:hypothetical protein L916_02755 [Phytophthora nicotianae]
MWKHIAYRKYRYNQTQSRSSPHNTSSASTPCRFPMFMSGSK